MTFDGTLGAVASMIVITDETIVVDGGARLPESPLFAG